MLDAQKGQTLAEMRNEVMKGNDTEKQVKLDKIRAKKKKKKIEKKDSL